MSNIDDKYHLVLYIDTAKPKFSVISERLREICKKHLSKPYKLEVIDLRANPELFERQRITAVPTLDVTTPQSQQQRFVGDLSVSESFIIAIGMFQDAEKMKRNAAQMEKNITNSHHKF
jgi:hypothetical protein